MRKLQILLVLAIAALLLLLVLGNQFFYTLQETEQAILTQFGRPVGKPVTEAGLHVKLPFVQKVNIMNKMIMEWDSQPEQVPTADKLFIFVDTYARWRIADPLLYYQSLRDEMSAQSRLDDILDGETRNAVAKHQLIELVRTDKKRKPSADPSLTTSTAPLVTNWAPISIGRDAIAQEIQENAKKKLSGLGIELIDIRFKRINYNTGVQAKVFERMISERQQIAEKFRSEGQGEAARIQGEMQRELNRIASEAYRTQQEIQGKADAEAIDIYAKAYNQSPEAVQFFQFVQTMQTYTKTLDQSTDLIMSTQGDLFKFIKDVNPAASPAGGQSGPAPAANQPAAPPKPQAANPATTATAAAQ